jgi:Tfp pilus assembly protein PilF
VRLFAKKPRTRSELLASADRARTRGRVRQAAEAYQAVLQGDPTDPSVNVKLGPLLAKLGDVEGAVRCFRVAAKRHLDAGFVDRAAGVTLTATGVFPLEPGFRLDLAKLNVARGRKQDAVATLLEGGRAQAKAGRPDLAASLLGKALEIEPWHLETCLALVPVLARNGHPESAREFLAGLEQRYRGPARRRVRWVAFRLSPGLGTFWRWLRA